MCCTLESTHSRKELFTEQAVLARIMCFLGRPHIVHQPFPFYVLSVPIFTTEESWLPVIKKLTLERTRGWRGGGVIWVDATYLRFFGVFFLEDKTPAPHVFSSCSFILRANF